MEVQAENVSRISGCIIPNEFQSDRFSIYVANNIDRNEETLSGVTKSNLFLTLAIRSKPFSGQDTNGKKSRL